MSLSTLLFLLLAASAVAQFNAASCSASAAAPTYTSVLPWGGNGLKIFNDVAKQISVAVFETEPGVGTAIGVALELLWPTSLPGSGGKGTPEYTVQQCALQYAVNKALITANSNVLTGYLATIYGYLQDFIMEVNQGQANYPQAINYLQDALMTCNDATNFLLTSDWSVQNSSFIPQSVTPIALQTMAVHLIVLREFVVNGLPTAPGGNISVYDSVPANNLLCTYQRYMSYFHTSWTYFVSSRQNAITVSDSYEIDAPGPDAKYRLANVTDSSSGTYIRVGGAFCTHGLGCNGGEPSADAVQELAKGTATAMYNDAVAMYALALEPLAYFHRFVPQLADQPDKFGLPWMTATLVRGPYTMNPKSQDVTTSQLSGIALPSFAGGSYSYASAFGVAPPYVMGGLQMFNSGNTNASVTLEVVGNCPPQPVIFGVSPDHFASTVTATFQSSNFQNQATNFANNPVGVTLTSLQVGQSTCSNGTCSFDSSTTTIAPPTPVQLSEITTVSMSISPDWHVYMSPILGTTPLLNQDIGSCASCVRINSVIGVVASFGRRTSSVQQFFGCIYSDYAPVNSTYDSILPWYWRSFTWLQGLQEAMAAPSQTLGQDLRKVVAHTIRPGRTSSFELVSVQAGALVNITVLQNLLYGGQNCNSNSAIFTPLYRSLAATAQYLALYLNPNTTTLPTFESYDSLLNNAINEIVTARGLMTQQGNFQTIPLMIPLAALEVTTRREVYLRNPNDTNLEAVVTAFGYYVNWLELAVPQWQAFRVPFFTSTVNGSSWTANDNLNGTSRDATASSSTLASNYASGTRDAMINEAASFMAVFLAPMSNLALMVNGMEALSGPVSFSGDTLTRGPYAAAPSVHFFYDRVYELVGYTPTTWDAQATVTAFQVTTGTGASPSVASLQARYGTVGGSVGGTPSGSPATLTGPSQGVDSLFGQFNTATGPNLRFVKLSNGAQAGTEVIAFGNNTFFNVTLGSSFRMVSTNYPPISGISGVAAFGAQFKLIFQAKTSNIRQAPAPTPCVFAPGSVCDPAGSPCCLSGSFCARHAGGTCNGTASVSTSFRCTSPSSGSLSSQDGVSLAVAGCDLIIYNSDPNKVGLVLLKVAGRVSTTYSPGCVSVSDGFLCQLGQLGKDERVVLPLRARAGSTIAIASLTFLKSDLQLHYVETRANIAACVK